MSIHLYRVGNFNDEIQKIKVRGFTPSRIARLSEGGGTSGTHRCKTALGQWFVTEPDAEKFISERKAAKEREQCM